MVGAIWIGKAVEQSLSRLTDKELDGCSASEKASLGEATRALKVDSGDKATKASGEGGSRRG